MPARSGACSTVGAVPCATRSRAALRPDPRVRRHERRHRDPRAATVPAVLTSTAGLTTAGERLGRVARSGIPAVVERGVTTNPVRQERRGEARLPAALAVLFAIALYALL